MSFLFPRPKSYCSIVSEPSARHQEHHFENPRVISDVIIGLSDGLTVPFALMAGLSSLGNAIVIAGGMAELISGAISMGLGGYLAASSEAKHYANERRREEKEIVECPEEEEEEIFEALAPYGVTREACQPIIECLRKNPKGWVDFMMKFELGLEETGMRRAWVSAGTIGISYFLGGLCCLISLSKML
ncbi:Vacuolar iron transporter 1 [Neolecta irregularis DAH-3]|uniref:Vacuolar iron transporter 1 n=1 Tax=Neolecta irregularis (strain DAH-3) TaxID=1198029 RepID=A0A1U7LGL6_NEOID|nr:Vacuolar iron transporter 1 [Neolecta irregularis DAH-3]|eukprot:OLL21692.1 Vacuolar iron transporter 1 [Neolecta irregularis DAH-3]